MEKDLVAEFVGFIYHASQHSLVIPDSPIHLSSVACQGEAASEAWYSLLLTAYSLLITGPRSLQIFLHLPHK